MRRIRLPVALVLMVGALLGGPLGLAGAQPATPTAVELPEAPAPYGLGGVQLPTDTDGIAALFERLPREVTGEVNDWQPTISRGNGFVAMTDGVDPATMHLSAVDLMWGGPRPYGGTAGEAVHAAATWIDAPPDAPIDPSVEGYGRDGRLAWVQRATLAVMTEPNAGGPAEPPPTSTVYLLEWGTIDSPWLFRVRTWTTEDREALVRAFVAAAGATTATPSP